MIVFRKIFNKNLNKFCSYEQIRFIPRWSSRQPKKVYLPDEYDSEDLRDILDHNNSSKVQNYPTKFSFQSKQPQHDIENEGDKRILTLRSSKVKKQPKTTDMLETVIDSDGNLVFTKMRDNDPRIAMVLSNIKSQNSQKKKQSMILEGKRLIEEALKQGCKLEYILFSRKSDVEDLKQCLPKMGAHIYKMPYKEMQWWSDLTTSPGIMGVFKIPEVSNLDYEIPVNIICDNIREPGNLGAIFRTCAGAGCKTLILTKGCCDMWNTKVLRSAMGAHFKLNILKLNWEQIKDRYKSSDWFIADNNLVKASRNSSLVLDTINKIPVVSYDKLKYSSNSEISLVIGGETEGVSEQAYSTIGELGGLRIHIPLGNNIESLNSGSALAVLLFEMRRQIKFVN